MTIYFLILERISQVASTSLRTQKLCSRIEKRLRCRESLTHARMESRGRGGTRAPTQAAQETSVWPSELPDAAQASAAMRLATAPKADTSAVHQKFGRPGMVSKSRQ